MIGLLPIILQKFSELETAFWLSLAVIQNFALLADFGFRTTIIRAYAYFSAGHSRLPPPDHSLPPNQVSWATDPASVLENNANLLSTSRLLYAKLSFASGLLALIGGPFVSWAFLAEGNFRTDFISALLMTGVSVAGTIWTYNPQTLIDGSGHILLSLRASIVSGILRFILSIGAIALGFGIVGLTAAVLLQQCIYYFLLYGIISKTEPLNNISSASRTVSPSDDLMAQLWPVAWRTSVTLGFGYFVYQAVAIIAARELSVNDAASFLLLHRLFQVSLNISRAPIGTAVPLLSSLRARGEQTRYRSVFVKKLRLALCVQIAAVGFLLFLAPPLLPLLNAKTQLPGTAVVAIFGVWSLLDAHHNAHASSYFTTNKVQLLAPVVLAAFLVSALAYLFAPMGALGLAVAQFAASLATVHWIAVDLNLKSLNWPILAYFKNFIRPASIPHLIPLPPGN